jgi:hypothetical protein
MNKMFEEQAHFQLDVKQLEIVHNALMREFYRLFALQKIRNLDMIAPDLVGTSYNSFRALRDYFGKKYQQLSGKSKEEIEEQYKKLREEKSPLIIDFYETSEDKSDHKFYAYKDAPQWLQLFIQNKNKKLKNIGDITFRKDKDGEYYLELMVNKAVVMDETTELSIIKKRIKLYDLLNISSESTRIEKKTEDKGIGERFLSIHWCYADIEAQLLQMLKLDSDKYSVPLDLLKEIGNRIDSVFQDCSVSAGWDYMQASIEDQFEEEELKKRILEASNKQKTEDK